MILRIISRILQTLSNAQQKRANVNAVLNLLYTMVFKQKTKSLMYPITILQSKLLIVVTLFVKTKCLAILCQRTTAKSTAFAKRRHQLLMNPRSSGALYLANIVIVILEARSYMEPMNLQLQNPKLARFYLKKMLRIMEQATATPKTFQMNPRTKDATAKSQAHLVTTTARWTLSIPRILDASSTKRCLNLN